MGELRSAFEKAWEKAERLGKLSEEEQRERLGEEFIPVGRRFAAQFLEHGSQRLLQEQLERFSGEERKLVLRGMILELLERIGLEDLQASLRALEGLRSLEDKGALDEIIGKFESLIENFKMRREEKFNLEKSRIERMKRDLLHQLRISGSAIAEINIEGSREWGEIERRIREEAEPQLEALRKEALELLQNL